MRKMQETPRVINDLQDIGDEAMDSTSGCVQLPLTGKRSMMQTYPVEQPGS